MAAEGDGAAGRGATYVLNFPNQRVEVAGTGDPRADVERLGEAWAEGVFARLGRAVELGGPLRGTGS